MRFHRILRKSMKLPNLMLRYSLTLRPPMFSRENVRYLAIFQEIVGTVKKGRSELCTMPNSGVSLNDGQKQRWRNSLQIH